MSRLEVPKGSQLYILEADLSDAFHHLELPPGLRDIFSMRPVRAAAAGLTELDGRQLAPGDLVVPRCKVCPMGWTWALWWCQNIHERICERAGVIPSLRLKDKSAVGPTSSVLHLQYVDNFAAISQKLEGVIELASAVTRELRGEGLSVKADMDAADFDAGKDRELLGWVFEGA